MLTLRLVLGAPRTPPFPSLHIAVAMSAPSKPG